MMYIDRLPKAEKERIKNEFIEKDESLVYRKAHRIFAMCLTGMIVGLLITAFDIINNTNIWNYVLDALLLIFCAVFGYRTYNLKKIELNKYALKVKDSNKKKK